MSTGPALNALAEYTALPPVNDLFRADFLRYASRCTYINFMRKPFEAKIMRVHETADDVRASVRSVGEAAEAQTTLLIALTAVSVTALLVAALLVHSAARTGAGR